MKRAQRLRDMSSRAEKRTLLAGAAASKPPVSRQRKTDRTTRWRHSEQWQPHVW